MRPKRGERETEREREREQERGDVVEYLNFRANCLQNSHGELQD